MNRETPSIRGLVASFALVVILAFGFLLVSLLIAIGTGPNCPGKDPQWLGFCSEAPPPV